ncbi:hypothetical protein B9Z55_026449 [Caenorhabditis nigoni]|uniref:Uncharacterized protein n=1 Tax=Caenorhabditis nigoni TaxID=1611254 RepID=A0A2G5T385_9PELO|nr:hypothetical protein B9Z55_026449 [Caenorhabditis nigoni]
MERVRPWVEAIPMDGNICPDEDLQIDDDVQKNYVITLDDEPYTVKPEDKERDRTPIKEYYRWRKQREEENRVRAREREDEETLRKEEDDEREVK